MDKTRQRILIAFIIVILLVAIFLIIATKDTNPINRLKTNNNKKEDAICNKVDDLQKKKSNFVIFVGKEGEDTKNNEIMNKIKKDYKQLTVIHVGYSKQNLTCMNKLIKECGLEEITKNQKNGYIVLYKNGEYVGAYTGIDSYGNIVDYLSSKGVIEKKRMEETTTLKDFYKDIKSNYVLFLVENEEHEQTIEPYVKKIFSDINNDIVNVHGQEGNKIYKKVIKEYKVDPRVPQAIYFKNSKKVTNQYIYNIEEIYLKLKQDIEKSK